MTNPNATDIAGSASPHGSIGVPPDCAATDDPGDRMTVTSLLAGYASAGYDGEMLVTSDGRVRCRSCGEEMDPHDIHLDSLRRVEGASDPDEMQAVVALSCPRCGAKGALVLSYGPMGSPEDAEVLAALDDHRVDSDLPEASSPADSPSVDSPAY